MLRSLPSRRQLALSSVATQRSLSSSGAVIAVRWPLRAGAASSRLALVHVQRLAMPGPVSLAGRSMSMTATATAQPAGRARLRTREPLIKVPAATELTRVSYTTNLLKETPDKYEAQEKLESWAKGLFANAEIAKQDRRERLRKTSPHAVEYVSQDPEFQKFIWTWANLIEERLNVFQLTGLQPDSQRILNRRHGDHQVFTNQDLGRLIVGALIEKLVNVCSNPHVFKKPLIAYDYDADNDADVDVDTDASLEAGLLETSGSATIAQTDVDVEAGKAVEAGEAGKVQSNWMRTHDILLVEAALELGQMIERELNARILGGSGHRKKLEAGEIRSPSVDKVAFTIQEQVKLGGDLLYLSQEHELALPIHKGDGGEVVVGRPWSKEYIRHPEFNKRKSKFRPSAMRFHPQLLKLCDRVEKLGVGHRDMPMLVPPRPATRTHNGGYITLKRSFLNAKQSRTREKAIDAARTSGAMDEMIQAINYLSSTPWRVSHTVLDDLERLWPDTEVSPALLPYMRTLRGLRIKPEDKVAVDLARNYRDVAFYNFVRPDYRGRIYPATTELSPVANDLARSLLVFDKKKQLGADGWRALKLHLAGLFGATKRASFDERLAWVDAHWDEIIDSGAKGLDGNRWYMTGDHAWQVRAACAEIARAAAYPEGPEAYPSSLPCHQDGSCNGLQHYAALARDVDGGSAVNLLPSERPADVYSTVLGRVLEKIEADAKSGHATAIFLLKHRAKTMVRDSVKRTVMTRVYGLTHEGAVRNATEFLQKIRLKGLDTKQLMPISRYWAGVTLESIAGLFPRATAIQSWFLTCANLILRSEGVDDEGHVVYESDMTMSWTTPLGFPVVQDIRKFESKSVLSSAGRLSVQDPDDPSAIDRRKELDAFAPNIIHSLDAAHLFRAALNCEHNGVTMGSVHDSFWTHAADIEILRDITRLTFVSQYRDDVLENLRREFLRKYGDNYCTKNDVAYAKRRHYERNELPYELGIETGPPLDAWATWGSTKTEGLTIDELLPPCPSSGQLDIELVGDSDFFFH